MIPRLVLGVGLVILGYFVGREVGRTESLREELERRRASSAGCEPDDRRQSRCESDDPGEPSPRA